MHQLSAKAWHVQNCNCLLCDIKLWIVSVDAHRVLLAPLTLQVFLDAWPVFDSIIQFEHLVILSTLLGRLHGLGEGKFDSIDTLVRFSTGTWGRLIIKLTWNKTKSA